MSWRSFWALAATGAFVTVGAGCSGSSNKQQFEVKSGSAPTAHERPLQPLDSPAPKGGTPKPKAVD